MLLSVWFWYEVWCESEEYDHKAIPQWTNGQTRLDILTLTSLPSARHEGNGLAFIHQHGFEHTFQCQNSF